VRYWGKASIIGSTMPCALCPAWKKKRKREKKGLRQNFLGKQGDNTIPLWLGVASHRVTVAGYLPILN
jgi:hypothetical protein